jgi:fatty-acid peroxygenase
MTIPHDPRVDGTLAVAREGYTFILSRCLRHRTEIFRTRLLGKPAVCIHGREANALFYDESKLVRHGALPRRVMTSLFGTKGVQTLDGDAHRRRKSAFLGLMSPQQLEALLALSAREWRAALERWQRAARVVLFDEAALVLTRASLTWAGVPFDDAEAHVRARDFVAMVDAFGGIGPRLWEGKRARRRSEAWLRDVVRSVRAGALPAAPGSALRVFAEHRDAGGRLLPARTAAIELINVVRPTVAIAWYISFAALALHEHPVARERLRGDERAASEFRRAFLQEVRRFYPFAPFLGAKVRARFSWKGFTFEPGTLVLLDIYGNQHDPELWDAPEAFRPERFLTFQDDGFHFTPQGGGAPNDGHRCPGEWITTSELELALRILTEDASYELEPAQDLGFELRRMPARPRSGVVLRQVRATAASTDARAVDRARAGAAVATALSAVPFTREALPA